MLYYIVHYPSMNISDKHAYSLEDAKNRLNYFQANFPKNKYSIMVDLLELAQEIMVEVVLE